MPHALDAPQPRWTDTVKMKRLPPATPQRPGNGTGGAAALREWPAGFWPVATFAAAALGAWGSAGAPDFYALLDRPDWAPPAAAFGPMWTLLYVLMAVAAWRVARTGHRLRRPALGLYGAQLLANAAWSWLFFRLHLGGAALAGSALLLALLVLSAVCFHRVRSSAGWMLVPAVIWVGFATALTLSLWGRNPAALGS